MLALALAAVVLAAPPGPTPDRGRHAVAARDTAPPAPAVPADAYVAAVSRLLERITGGASSRVLILPTSAGHDVAVRARRASGPPIAATDATARAVARVLVGRGFATAASARSLAPAGDALQLVLGELRYEPATAPRFARLRIAVIGTDSTRANADFLLRREPAGWRAINMRTSGLAPRVR